MIGSSRKLAPDTLRPLPALTLANYQDAFVGLYRVILDDSLKNTALALSVFLWIASVEAEIFGDGDFSNGIEDNRIPLVASSSAIYQRFVGTVECNKTIRGTAVLLDVLDAEVLGVPVSRPVLLTAKHVLMNQSQEYHSHCSYRPTGTSWNSAPIPSPLIARKAGDLSDQILFHPLIREYLGDWVVVAMTPWPAWESYAFRVAFERGHLFDTALTDADEKPGQKAFFVGYDAQENRLLIDPNCEFGPSVGADILGELNGLIWDNCDSAPGSSGGVLFSNNEDRPHILGIRVGSLYDVEAHPDGPLPGEKFDVDTNINVTRVFDHHIQQQIRALLEGQGSYPYPADR